MMAATPRTACAIDRILRAWMEALLPEVITVIVSPPSRVVSPNARVHWSIRSKAVKKQRIEAWAQAQIVMHEAEEKGGWREATCQAHVYVRDNRRRDKDNALASLKATFDGLVDAGLLHDDSALTHLPLVFLIDAKNPRVELLLKRWDKQ